LAMNATCNRRSNVQLTCAFCPCAHTVCSFVAFHMYSTLAAPCAAVSAATAPASRNSSSSSSSRSSCCCCPWPYCCNNIYSQ
jgi:hypothetical protein